MWQVTKIEARNFSCLGDLTIKPDGCTVVQAQNKDDSGQESNGGGKTSYLDLAPVAILGQSVSGRELKKCVRYGKDSFVIEINLTHPVIGELFIHRTVFAGTKSMKLMIVLNGEVPKELPAKGDFVDIIEGNKWIIKTIGISREDLLNYYFINEEHYVSFFKTSPAKKVEIINRFSRADTVNSAIKRLEEYWDKYEGEQIILEKRSVELATSIDVIGDLISSNTTIDRKAVSDAILGNEKQIEGLKIILNDESQGVTLESMYENLSVLKKKEESISNDWSDVNVIESNAKKSLLESIKCPRCSHIFSLRDKDFNLETAKGELDIANTTLAVLSKMMDTVKDDRRVFKNAILKLEMEIMNAKKDAQAKINTLSEDVIRFKGVINEYDSVNDQRELVKKNEIELKKVDASLEILTEKLKKVYKWMEYYKEFKFYLANKPLDIICGYINDFLIKTNTNLSIVIEGFKKLKNKEIRQELNPVIYRDGSNGESYRQYSGGEKVRVNIAADLSFQELINSSSESGGLNWYQNDELMNGLDELGVSLAAKSFDDLGKPILLVSHSGNNINYEKSIMLVKKNGISKIE